MPGRALVTGCLIAGLTACGGTGGDGGPDGFWTPDIVTTPDGTLPDEETIEPTGCTGHAACTAELADQLNPCEEGRCAEDGTCVVVVSEDGVSCDDHAPCTEGDVCTAGVCGGLPRSCDDENPCTEDTCDPKEAESPCLHTLVEGLCDDGDFCTVDDTCTDSGCVGVPTDCSAMDGDCAVGQCDPSNGACLTVLSEDGSTCDDGDFCTSEDTCQAGACAGSLTDCSHIDSVCGTGYCEPETGACVALLINEGGACDDNNPNTAFDTCVDGECVCLPQCEGKACGPDGCGGICSGGCDPGETCNQSQCVCTCDNGSYCDGVETCDPTMGCVPGQPPVVDDGVECTFDFCDEEGDAIIHEPNDWLCNDDNPCTVDTCEFDTGCVHTPTAGPCDDANACTEDDTCDDAGGCVP
ncbi:MAG: hypothetical protein QF464_19720, partial [Myxococcota bacterium]|nr:hypothetical protein [Myxococcota bacterium]